MFNVDLTNKILLKVANVILDESEGIVVNLESKRYLVYKKDTQIHITYLTKDVYDSCMINIINENTINLDIPNSKGD